MDSFFEWYIGFFPHAYLAWTTALATLTFALTFIIKPSRQFVIGQWKGRKQRKRRQESSLPIIDILIDEEDNLSLASDEKIHVKIELAKQIFRSQNSKCVEIRIKPSFLTKKMDKYQKRSLCIKLEKLSKEIEKKIEILFKVVDVELEYTNSLLIALHSLLKRPKFSPEKKTKIDLYKTQYPKINFAIWLNEGEMQNLAEHNDKTVEELKRELMLPMYLTTTIFTQQILLQHVVPWLARTIYGIYEDNNFDINMTGWEYIYYYEVGLG